MVVDYVWSMLKNNLVKERINVFDILLEMRRQRQALVQTVVTFIRQSMLY